VLGGTKVEELGVNVVVVIGEGVIEEADLWNLAHKDDGCSETRIHSDSFAIPKLEQEEQDDSSHPTPKAIVDVFSASIARALLLFGRVVVNLQEALGSTCVVDFETELVHFESFHIETDNAGALHANEPPLFQLINIFLPEGLEFC